MGGDEQCYGDESNITWIHWVSNDKSAFENSPHILTFGDRETVEPFVKSKKLLDLERGIYKKNLCLIAI